MAENALSGKKTFIALWKTWPLLIVLNGLCLELFIWHSSNLYTAPSKVSHLYNVQFRLKTNLGKKEQNIFILFFPTSEFLRKFDASIRSATTKASSVVFVQHSSFYILVQSLARKKKTLSGQNVPTSSPHQERIEDLSFNLLPIKRGCLFIFVT